MYSYAHTFTRVQAYIHDTYAHACIYVFVCMEVCMSILPGPLHLLVLLSGIASHILIFFPLFPMLCSLSSFLCSLCSLFSRLKSYTIPGAEMHCLAYAVRTVVETWRRVWGDGKNFRRPRWRFFWKIPILPAKVSDDLFLSSTRFFEFSLSSHWFSGSLLCLMSYMTLSSQENTFFFTIFILSRTSDNNTSQNIGGTNAWAVSPTSNFGGTVPQPPRFPPLASCARQDI